MLKKGQIINPNGKGGFGERKEDINAGGRPKHSPQYWLQHYGKLSNKEFKKLITDFANDKLDDELTVNQVIALRHISESNVFEVRKDLLNRVDGMPKQRQEITGKDGEPIGISMSYVDALKMIDDELKKVNNGGINENQPTDGESISENNERDNSSE